jgi:hypothetical protein
MRTPESGRCEAIVDPPDHRRSRKPVAPVPCGGHPARNGRRARRRSPRAERSRVMPTTVRGMPRASTSSHLWSTDSDVLPLPVRPAPDRTLAELSDVDPAFVFDFAATTTRRGSADVHLARRRAALPRPEPRPDWLSPARPPSTPTSGSSRPARRPTSSCSSGPSRRPGQQVVMAAKRYRERGAPLLPPQQCLHRGPQDPQHPRRQALAKKTAHGARWLPAVGRCRVGRAGPLLACGSRSPTRSRSTAPRS